MVLLLRRQEADGLLDLEQAIELTNAAVLEEVAGTTLHMSPFGGSGWARRIMRVTGAGLYGFGRLGIRASSLTLLFDINDGTPLAIMDLPIAEVRLAASAGLAARHLARPNARRVGLIGSGSIALPMLQGLCAVRPIEAVDVYSRTPEHRTSFAEHAGHELGIPVAAKDDATAVMEKADILAVATNARAPVVTYEQLQPGTHVTSFGLVGELDGSVYLRADQLVAASREQEIENAQPTKTPGRITGGVLFDLLTAGSLTPESITDLGAIAHGDVAVRNGPADINVFRDSRGGVGEAAFASWVYDRARERDLGIEFDFG
jgi:ornithine cyclodeaminase/alanine dehydrogenase-like protein (mu-crystallin family)